MLLRKHNYSYKFLCHLEGKEQKKSKKKKIGNTESEIEFKKCFLFNGTPDVSFQNTFTVNSQSLPCCFHPAKQVRFFH